MFLAAELRLKCRAELQLRELQQLLDCRANEMHTQITHGLAQCHVFLGLLLSRHVGLNGLRACSMGRACSAWVATCHKCPAAKPLVTASRVRATNSALSTPTPCCLSHFSPALPHTQKDVEQLLGNKRCACAVTSLMHCAAAQACTAAVDFLACQHASADSLPVAYM